MKKISTLLMVALLSLSVFSFNGKAEASSLKDIQNHWAKNEIEYLVQRGIISGYSDGTFKPNGTITKAQAAIMIGRAMGVPGQTPTDTRFSDVFRNVAGSGYINELDKLDIIGPEKDNFYHPNKLVTRERALNYMIWSGLSSLENKLYPNPFTDIPKDSASDVLLAYQNGIANGYSDGTFRPNETVTRAQFSVFLTKYLKIGK